MSLVVKDPKSNTKVAAGLLAASRKQNSIPPANQFLKPLTASTLATNVVTFPAQVATMDSDESIKINLNLIDGIALEKLKKQSTLFLETVNGQIELGIYPASVRVNFLMNADSKVLPKMDTIADILGVAAAIKTGNLALIALHLPPPADFTAAQNDLLNIDYATKATASNTATEVFMAAATIVATSRTINRALCTTIRKELQFHCVSLNKSAMRDYCRLWGIVFQTKKISTEIDILAIYADGTGIAPGTLVRIGQVDTEATIKVKTPSIQGASGVVNAHGTLDLDTTQVGDLFLICNQIGCNELVVPITIIAGDDQSVTVHLVKSAPEAA